MPYASLLSDVGNLLSAPGAYFVSAIILIGVVIGWIFWYPRHQPPVMRPVRSRPDPDGDAYSRVYSALNQERSSMGLAYLSYRLDSAVFSRTGRHASQVHTFTARLFGDEEIDEAGTIKHLNDEIDQTYRTALRLEALRTSIPIPKREIRRLSGRLRRRVPKLVEETEALLAELGRDHSTALAASGGL